MNRGHRAERALRILAAPCASAVPRRRHLRSDVKLVPRDVTHTGSTRRRGFGRMRAHTFALLATFALVAGAAGVLLGAQPSGASVVTVGGQVVLVSPPAVLEKGIDSSVFDIHMFTERTAFTLPQSLPVDITPGGTFPQRWKTGDPTSPSTVAAGTPIDSYLMCSNPPSDAPSYNYVATVTFSTPILGVMITGSTIETTDPIVGAPGTSYQYNVVNPGLNTGNSPDPLNPDAVELVNDSAINVNFHTMASINCMRVITVASPSTSPGQTGGSPGYTEVASDGGLFDFGNPFYGSMGGHPLNDPMVGGTQVTGQPGYWTVASDGGVFSFGDAGFYGSMGGKPLNAPIVGMASTPDGLGYWLVASDGGIFSYGDAGFFGSRGGKRLNAPIVGMASTPDGLGYWLVASDGGIFSYGDASFYGSTGSLRLNKPVVGMASTPDGLGYWLVASDGGIFDYGDASFDGSMGGKPLNEPMVGVVPTGDGLGYWTVASDGGIFSFGDATFLGSMGGIPLNKPVVSAF
jgi:hypothetical protein